MMEFFGISTQALFGQLLLGLINGSFYALLSLGLAVIFGMMNVVNMAHGAFYMVGAFAAWLLLNAAGVGYWNALWMSPVLVGALGWVLERTMLRRLYQMDHLYGLLLTFGSALVLEGVFRHFYGVSGLPYPIPSVLTGGFQLGFAFLPKYRAWVIVASLLVCLLTWLVIERTRLGAYLRASTENPVLVKAFGINVPLMIGLTYAFGVGLAAFAGVLAAPIYQVSPLMGSNLVIVVFAVVVIGGMGSIGGAILAGLALGLLEGLTKVFYPEASNIVVFIVMALVLLVKPAGLFGKAGTRAPTHTEGDAAAGATISPAMQRALQVGALVAVLLAPAVLYPMFLMKVMCFAIFACAFNLLIGFGGLVSFGHAAFFGGAAYVTAHSAKVWGLGPELSLLLGCGFAALLGLVFGAVAIRRQGIYFAMITLALAQMVFFLALQLKFTGGEDGIQAVPRGQLFGFIDLENNLAMYYFVAAVFLGCLLLIRRIVYSPFGQTLKAIRENEPRAISLGYKTDRYKLLAFVLSAGLAGLAGGLKALAFQLASLTDVAWQMSGEVVLMTLLGGLGTLVGPVVGAGLVITLESYLAKTSLPAMAVIGGIFVVCVLTFRRGLYGELRLLWLRRSRGSSEQATEHARS